MSRTFRRTASSVLGSSAAGVFVSVASWSWRWRCRPTQWLTIVSERLTAPSIAYQSSISVRPRYAFKSA